MPTIEQVGTLLNAKTAEDVEIVSNAASATLIGDPIVLTIQIILSVIGWMYFTYGKKHNTTIPIISGISLMLVAFFISNWMILLGISFIFIILPLILKFR